MGCNSNWWGYNKKVIEMFNIYFKELSKGGADGHNKCIDSIDQYEGSF